MRPQEPSSRKLEGAARPRRSRSRPFWLLPAVIAALAIAVGGLALLSRDADHTGRVIRIDIPAGTQVKIDRGIDPKAFPDRIVGRVGDTLVIRNHDSTEHTISGFPVQPDQRLEIPLRRAGTYETTCSAHQNDRLKMIVRE